MGSDTERKTTRKVSILTNGRNLVSYQTRSDEDKEDFYETIGDDDRRNDADKEGEDEKEVRPIVGSEEGEESDSTTEVEVVRVVRRSNRVSKKKQTIEEAKRTAAENAYDADESAGEKEERAKSKKTPQKKRKGRAQKVSRPTAEEEVTKLRPELQEELDRWDQEFDFDLYKGIEASLLDNGDNEQELLASLMTRIVQISAQQAKGRRAMSKLNKELVEKINNLEGQMVRNEERRKKEWVDQEKKWRQDMKKVTEQEVEELKEKMKGMKREIKILQKKVDTEQGKDEGRGQAVTETQGETQLMLKIHQRVKELTREMRDQRVVDKVVEKTRGRQEQADLNTRYWGTKEKQNGTKETKYGNNSSCDEEDSMGNNSDSHSSDNRGSEAREKSSERKRGDEDNRNLMIFGTAIGKRDETSVREVLRVTGVATKEMIIRIDQVGPRRDILKVMTAGQEDAEKIWRKKSTLEVLGWRLAKDRTYEERQKAKYEDWQKAKGGLSNRGGVRSEARGTGGTRGDKGGGRFSGNSLHDAISTLVDGIVRNGEANRDTRDRGDGEEYRAERREQRGNRNRGYGQRGRYEKREHGTRRWNPRKDVRDVRYTGW